MLNLYVMRHSKSSWKNKSLKDYDRPLSKKGKLDIKIISEFLKGKKTKFDLAYVSKSKRTQQTYKSLEKKIKINKVIFSKKLYLCDSDTILKFIKRTKSKYKNLLLINHEPLCKKLILKLIKKKYIKFKENLFKTSSIAKINFDNDKWNKIKNYSGKLKFFKTLND